jgi:hypothetical protein
MTFFLYQKLGHFFSQKNRYFGGGQKIDKIGGVPKNAKNVKKWGFGKNNTPLLLTLYNHKVELFMLSTLKKAPGKSPGHPALAAVRVPDQNPQ